jgi:Tol biopolymer transport system component/DNA-binding winged helix-turn-helix (wHTH) protein
MESFRKTFMRERVKHGYEFGPFFLSAAERLLLRDGDSVPLTPKAFDLLLTLVEHHGHLLEKDELLRLVWPDTFVEESNLSYNISLIRKALSDGENGQKFIETVPKRGYRFVSEVRELGAAQAENTAAVTNPAEGETAPVSRVRPYSKGAPLALIIALGGVGFGLYQYITRTEVKSSRLESKIVPFTSVPGSESQPAFSPDGKQIAFVGSGEKGDNEDIYVKLLDAGDALRLTTSPAAETSPAWSPDGRYLAFVRQTAEEAGVYVVPALGGPERKLTRVDGYVVTVGKPLRLAWSPDSEWLAVADRTSTAEPFNISLLSVTTRDKRKLTTPPADSFGDWSPAFSPDGKTLAFIRGKTGVHQDIYRMSVSGGEAQQLTFDSAHKKSLAWTADGREIIFSSSRGGSVNTAMLWKIPATGGTPERLAGVGQNVFFLAIAPQGNRLAYEQRIHDTNVYRVDTSDAASQSRTHTKLIASTFQDDSPNYSPNGKRIAFVSDRTGSLEIWLCDSEGGNAMPLTNFGGPHTGTPRWSPDGRWIYFCSNRSGAFQTWKTSVEGGQAVQVTRHGGFEGFASADGKFIYYGKTIDFPSIWRMPVAGSEETPVLDLQKTEHRRSWVVVEKGIYFAAAETATRSVVEFFSFATGRVERRVATLERAIKQGPPGLEVSPDGRWLLYTRIDQSGSDIMLMEYFR